MVGCAKPPPTLQRLFGPTHLRRAGARVLESFARRRADRVVADALEDPRPQTFFERGLDESVLAAVETDDRGPAARSQAARENPQQLLKVGQFAIDQQAQGVKDAGRG